MTPSVVWFKKMLPNVCRKTHEDLFFGGHIKKVFMFFVWRKFLGKSRTKTFRANLGKFGQKSFAPPKIWLLLTCALTQSWFALLKVNARSDSSARPASLPSCIVHRTTNTKTASVPATTSMQTNLSTPFSKLCVTVREIVASSSHRSTSTFA